VYLNVKYVIATRNYEFLLVYNPSKTIIKVVLITSISRTLVPFSLSLADYRNAFFINV